MRTRSVRGPAVRRCGTRKQLEISLVNLALTLVFMRIWDRIGSATPFRDFQMQPIGRDLADVVVRHSRMTAFAGGGFST
jgi:hypothetical protein